MASPILPIVLFLSVMPLLLANEATAENNQSNTIELGSRLSPHGTNSSWVSSSGHFAFGFYPHGNNVNAFGVGIWLVTPPNNTVVWTANRDSPPLSSNSTLELSKHGRLLLRNGDQDPQDLIPDDTEPVASAVMHDSGNFVLYDENFSVVWQSSDHLTDTILGGQNLTLEHQLVSSVSESDHSSGRFFLSMQADGNLVAYPVNSSGDAEDAYWNYMGSNSDQLSLNLEGFLCRGQLQCLPHGTNHRSKPKNISSIYRATLEFDGTFRLYEHQFGGTSSPVQQILLSAFPDNECQIKGFCGFNSYCSNITGNAMCMCYPGFVPSKTSENTMFLDCKPNQSKADCESSQDPTMLYNVASLENIYFGDFPYSVVPMKMETCDRSCREDCDCGAVLYVNGKCKKHKLPIRYGRKLESPSGVALFKVPSRNVVSTNQTLTALSPMKPRVIVDNKTNLIMILAITLGSIFSFFLLFAVFIFFTYKRQVHKYIMLSASGNLGFTGECSLHSFSFDELAKSTGGFTEEVGRGSFGAVYRGTIGDSKTTIAVKRLERIVDEGEREFRAEITAIARTHHRNLVKLIGFCIDDSRKLLVYEYLSNGSLANLLFKAERRLSWRDRIKIALDVARGVLYLHEECEVRIIHCNIKPQNILMDEAWTAKISDFGLARLIKPELSRTNRPGDEGMMSGYLAPEWQKDASVSVKVDIYSYGVVLLEIVCRRSNIDVNVSSADEILLSSWVYQCFVTGQLNKLVALEADEDVDWRTLERMVKVGLWCVQDDPSLRPSIQNVILMLEGLKDVSIPPSPVHLAM